MAKKKKRNVQRADVPSALDPFSTLCNALINSDIPKFQELVATHPDLIGQCSGEYDEGLGRGGTIVHKAVYAGNLHMLQFIIDQYGNDYDLVNNTRGYYDNDRYAECDKTQWTPLICASYFGNIEIVRYLLTLDNINIESKSGEGLNAEQHASNQEIRKLLYDYRMEKQQILYLNNLMRRVLEGNVGQPCELSDGTVEYLYIDLYSVRMNTTCSVPNNPDLFHCIRYYVYFDRIDPNCNADHLPTIYKQVSAPRLKWLIYKRLKSLKATLDIDLPTDVVESTYLADFQKLRELHSVPAFINESETVNIVPSLLQVSSDYFSTVFSNRWNAEIIRLHLVGTDEDSYNRLSIEMKAASLRIIMNYFHLAELSVDHNALTILHICKAMRLHDDNLVKTCLEKVKSSLEHDNILLFILQTENLWDTDPTDSVTKELRAYGMKYLRQNWAQINTALGQKAMIEMLESVTTSYIYDLFNSQWGA